MLTGLEILLARMKEYPEEFIDPNGKWRKLLKEIIPYLEKDEMVALEYGIRDAMRDKFNESVLAHLAGVSAETTTKETITKADPNKFIGILPGPEEYHQYEQYQNQYQNPYENINR